MFHWKSIQVQILLEIELYYLFCHALLGILVVKWQLWPAVGFCLLCLAYCCWCCLPACCCCCCYWCCCCFFSHCVVGIIWHLIGSLLPLPLVFGFLLLLLPLHLHCAAQSMQLRHEHLSSSACLLLSSTLLSPFFLSSVFLLSLLLLLLHLFGLLALFPFCVTLCSVFSCCLSHCCCCCCCYCCYFCCCALVNFSTHHCIIFWRARQPENGNTQICAFDASFFLLAVSLCLALFLSRSLPLTRSPLLSLFLFVVLLSRAVSPLGLLLMSCGLDLSACLSLLLSLPFSLALPS